MPLQVDHDDETMEMFYEELEKLWTRNPSDTTFHLVTSMPKLEQEV